MLDEIVKLPFNKATNIAAIILGTVIAPFWYIYQFFPTVYKTEEIIKLLLICISIGAPIIYFNFITFYRFNFRHQIEEDSENAEKLTIDCLVMASFTTCFVLYLPCILSYLISFDFHKAIKYSIFTQLGAFGDYIINGIVMIYKKGKKIFVKG